MHLLRAMLFAGSVVLLSGAEGATGAEGAGGSSGMNSRSGRVRALASKAWRVRKNKKKNGKENTNSEAPSYVNRVNHSLQPVVMAVAQAPEVLELPKSFRIPP